MIELQYLPLIPGLSLQPSLRSGLGTGWEIQVLNPDHLPTGSLPQGVSLATVLFQVAKTLAQRTNQPVLVDGLSLELDRYQGYPGGDLISQVRRMGIRSFSELYAGQSGMYRYGAVFFYPEHSFYCDCPLPVFLKKYLGQAEPQIKDLMVPAELLSPQKYTTQDIPSDYNVVTPVMQEVIRRLKKWKPHFRGPQHRKIVGDPWPEALPSSSTYYQYDEVIPLLERSLASQGSQRSHRSQRSRRSSVHSHRSLMDAPVAEAEIDSETKAEPVGADSRLPPIEVIPEEIPEEISLLESPVGSEAKSVQESVQSHPPMDKCQVLPKEFRHRSGRSRYRARNPRSGPLPRGETGTGNNPLETSWDSLSRLSASSRREEVTPTSPITSPQPPTVAQTLPPRPPVRHSPTPTSSPTRSPPTNSPTRSPPTRSPYRRGRPGRYLQPHLKSQVTFSPDEPQLRPTPPPPRSDSLRGTPGRRGRGLTVPSVDLPPAGIKSGIVRPKTRRGRSLERRTESLNKHYERMSRSLAPASVPNCSRSPDCPRERREPPRWVR